MAARRLIIVLLVLLGLSTVAAVLVPAPPPPGPETDPTETTTEPPRKPAGRLVEATIDASAKRLQVVEMRVGDRLSLRILSPAADIVELSGLGQLEHVDSLAPASFDLFAFKPGTFAVRLLEADRTIGEVVIRRRTTRR